MDGVKDLKGINCFRGMKGWFIYFIVIYHTFDGSGVLAQLFEPIKRYGGYFGNYIFFMMSGFLVEYSFSKVKVADRDFLTYIMNRRTVRTASETAIAAIITGQKFIRKSRILTLLYI